MAFSFPDPHEWPYREGCFFLGHSERGHEIGIKTERHAITIAGARSGKGAALLIPNARRWPHNLLCIDPKGENAALSWEARAALGQNVYVIDPFKEANVPDRLRAAFNPLAAIDLRNSRARATLAAIGNGLVVVHDPKHMEWVAGARSMLSGLAAYVVADAPPQFRTFAKLRELLMQPNELPADDDGNPRGLYADAQRMAQDTRAGGLIRSAGTAIMTAIESEKSMEKDFLGNARRATEWLDDESISAVLDHSTFDLSELKTGKASVYLVLPAGADFMATYAPFLRLFVKASLNAMGGGGDGRGSDTGEHCLFLLDEFYSLGKIEELTEAAGRMPSYGVHLWPFLQDLGQLIELYGPNGAHTFFGNADAHIFFGNSDTPTLNHVSDRLGRKTLDDIGVTPPRASFAPSSVATHEYIAPPSATPHFGNKKLQGAAVVTDIFRQSLYSARLQEQADARRVDEILRGLTATSDANAMRDYQHALSAKGDPRLTPDEVQTLVGKRQDALVARSMIVFMGWGTPLNLKLAPYFLPPPPLLPSQSEIEIARLEEKLPRLLIDIAKLEKNARAIYDDDPWNTFWAGVAGSGLIGVAQLFLLLSGIIHYPRWVTMAVILGGGILGALSYLMFGLGYQLHKLEEARQHRIETFRAAVQKLTELESPSASVQAATLQSLTILEKAEIGKTEPASLPMLEM